MKKLEKNLKIKYIEKMKKLEKIMRIKSSEKIAENEKYKNRNKGN